MVLDDPGSVDAAVSAANLPDTWQWKSATVEVASAGPHTLRVWMREDGVAFDEIVITSNADYSPADPSAAMASVNSASYRLRNKMFGQCLVSRNDGTAGLGACSDDDSIGTLRDMGPGFLDAGVLFDNAATGRGFIHTTTLTGATGRGRR